MSKVLERMQQQYGLFAYGRVIPGLMIHGKPAPYPVLNERAIRAGAGIVFAFGMFSFSKRFTSAISRTSNCWLSSYFLIS